MFSKNSQDKKSAPSPPSSSTNLSSSSSPPSNAPKSESFSTLNAGVGGLIKKRTEKALQTDASLQEAFKDIDALMVKAKDMVELAKKFSSAQSKDEDQQNGDFRDLMISMGIANPVTKKSAGASYHSELAKQISDFMEDKLTKLPGKMLPLAQVYCIYNRARGLSLISPDDLYRSCMLMNSLNLPIQLREFESGVLALQLRNHNDLEFAKRIEETIKNSGPQTVAGIAMEFSISLTMSKELLLLAESQELLCRDKSLEGLIFYANLFPEF